MQLPPKAVLVLEDGKQFTGYAYGAIGEALGEVVFSTGMTGYQETLTDPSYCRQIVVMTAPHIGNTGFNDEDNESTKIQVAGYVVRDPARVSSNWRATSTLTDALVAQEIVGISGIDTRALTKHLRDMGSMRAGIFSGTASELPSEHLLARVQQSEAMAGADLSAEVSTDTEYVVPAIGQRRFKVVALDLGIKSMTPTLMAKRGIEVVVVPAHTTWDEIQEHEPDGFFLSNGPGDPATATHAVALVQQALSTQLPFFGICFGNQLLGRALGLDTYKLKFGHRGINQPVLDKETGKVEITAQNHGFAVAAPLTGDFYTKYGKARVSHIGLNDEVVEGLECLEVPAFSVQYHPEAAAGPHDSEYLFDRFVALMEGAK